MPSLMDLDALNLYGFGPDVSMPTAGPAAPTQSMAIAAGDIATGWRALVDPRNPLFWLGAVLAVTFGAAGISGSARVGNVKVSGQAGDPD